MSVRLEAAALAFAKYADPDLLAGVTPWALEDRLMAYAAENARPGESTAAAITRLCREDELAKALARAAYHAEQLLQRTMTSEERLDAFNKYLGKAEDVPAVPSQDEEAEFPERRRRRRRRQEAEAEKRFHKRAAAESGGLDETAPAIYSALERIAKAEAQPGENFYDAFDRLSRTDADFAAGLRLYDRLHGRS